MKNKRTISNEKRNIRSNSCINFIIESYWWILVDENTKSEDIGTGSYFVDKNGKEIYEGDIVKDGSRLWKIEISPIYGIFFILSKGGHTRCYGDFASYLVDDFQVIGNIYENQELLEGLK